VRLSNGFVIKDSRVDFFKSTSGLAGQIPFHFRHRGGRLFASNAGCSVNSLGRRNDAVFPVIE
jgi:hypothetical protein